ncbi:uncharacterized protein STEHIDRAFT_118856 [Stereum hirsutum FP-91666 SS1]|uniref:uncharacterized protein n=1 Tax=Stereum hirsutum (strain FP-91666) TaxID=721885 RepID=UPI000440A47E|nr:uncharacterized protein STEHIDRAFT_118856 [Stereum hirsutum FP-91666 SS1]EIM89737.1 hypothetical protein STEHIDRAFT_118856 [Stereum hirsutum FP-91666 SS1]
MASTTAAASTSASASGSSNKLPQPTLIAQGDWTKNLVHLAKTAELKKHALTLQLHTAHILSAHATLDQRQQAIQDLKEQKNKLESERERLLKCLREVNEDRDKADMEEARIQSECTDLRNRIRTIEDGDYALAKRDVDALRSELDEPPLPSLQQVLEEKSQQYLNERRLSAEQNNKRAADVMSGGGDGSGSGSAQPPGKRPRGRPKGSKTRGGKAQTGGAGASGSG